MTKIVILRPKSSKLDKNLFLSKILILRLAYLAGRGTLLSAGGTTSTSSPPTSRRIISSIFSLLISWFYEDLSSDTASRRVAASSELTHDGGNMVAKSPPPSLGWLCTPAGRVGEERRAEWFVHFEPRSWHSSASDHGVTSPQIFTLVF